MTKFNTPIYHFHNRYAPCFICIYDKDSVITNDNTYGQDITLFNHDYRLIRVR